MRIQTFMRNCSNPVSLITTTRNKRKHDEEPEIISTRITPCFYFLIHFRFWRHKLRRMFRSELELGIMAMWRALWHKFSKYGKCTVSKQPNAT